MRRALFIVMVFTLPAFVAGQPCAVTGKVKASDSGAGLPGATVLSKLDHTRGVTTDANGNFEITLHEHDTLIVSYMGYEPRAVVAGDIVNCYIDIQLTPVATTFQEVEIRAERIISEEFTIRKIKKLDIYTNPSAKADPILAVNSMPSATTLDESANISLRGGSPAETGVFLNNVPINDAVRYSQMNGIGTFSIFNTALINNVQVYAGNPPLEYGNSTSGLIALQTDENMPPKRTTTASLTLASIGIYSSGKTSRNSSLTLFSNYQPSALIKSINPKALKDLKKFMSADLGIHFYQKIGDKGAFKIFNYTLRESYRFQHNEPSYAGTFNQEKWRNFSVVNLRKQIGRTELSVNHGLSFSRAAYRYGTTDIDLRLHDFFSSINFHRTGTLLEWKTGLTYDRKGSLFDGKFPVFPYAGREQHPTASARQRDLVSTPEWYAYLKYFFASRWVAGSGIRKNMGPEKYTSFQGNLLYKIGDQWKVNLSGGRYFKFQLPQGESTEPVLIESTQYSFDMSFAGRSTETSVSLFAKNGKRHLSKTLTKGIEIYSRYKLHPNVRCQLSLTSLDATEKKDSITLPSPYNIHYFVRGNLEYKMFGTWTMTLVFLFRQGSYYVPVISADYHSELDVYIPVYSQYPERLPAYRTIDFCLSKIFLLTRQSTAVAFASAGNLLNNVNVRDYSYNADYSKKNEYLFSQRTVYCGMVINF